MKRFAWLWICLMPLGGCGGHYILLVPDQLAPAGQDTVPVTRLLRNDFFVLELPVRDAAIEYRVGPAKERAAYTDDIGYAATSVPVPEKLGRYDLTVRHMDHESDVVETSVPLYVWDPALPVVAVDMDSLPRTAVDRWSALKQGLTFYSTRPKGSSSAKPAAPSAGAGMQAAATALRQIAQGANLVYMTRQDVREHASLHEWLARGGYPDGAILLWQRQRWHIVREGKYRIPKIVIESRMVGQLGELKKQFPKLTTGVTAAGLSAKGFTDAGLKAVVVGGQLAAPAGSTRCASWQDLAARGL